MYKCIFLEMQNVSLMALREEPEDPLHPQMTVSPRNIWIPVVYVKYYKQNCSAHFCKLRNADSIDQLTGQTYIFIENTQSWFSLSQSS